MSKFPSPAVKMDVVELAMLVPSDSRVGIDSDELELCRNEIEYCDYYDLDSRFDGEHRYEIASQENQLEWDAREIERAKGREYVKIVVSTEVASRKGNFYGWKNLSTGGGAISNFNSDIPSGDYTLTIGTCGELAPGWVAEAYHSRPMWILHCPDLPAEHIEGCCFFDGLAGSPLGALNHLSENEKISVTYISWGLGKCGKVMAQVAPALLESLRDANEREGSILMAFIGNESCALKETLIPVGMVEWLEYELSLMRSENAIGYADSELRLIAETAIKNELMMQLSPPRICRLVLWSALPLNQAGAKEPIHRT